jgi:hypothetical protein
MIVPLGPSPPSADQHDKIVEDLLHRPTQLQTPLVAVVQRRRQTPTANPPYNYSQSPPT